MQQKCGPPAQKGLSPRMLSVMNCTYTAYASQRQQCVPPSAERACTLAPCPAWLAARHPL